MTPAPSLEFDPSELNQLCGLRVLEMNPADFGGPDAPADFNEPTNDPDALNEAMDEALQEMQDEADELELQNLSDEEDDEDEGEQDDEDDDLPYEDCFTEAGDMYNDDRDE